MADLDELEAMADLLMVYGAHDSNATQAELLCGAADGGRALKDALLLIRQARAEGAREIVSLRAEVERYRESDLGEAVRALDETKQAEIDKLRAEVEQWRNSKVVEWADGTAIVCLVGGSARLSEFGDTFRSFNGELFAYCPACASTVRVTPAGVPVDNDAHRRTRHPKGDDERYRALSAYHAAAQMAEEKEKLRAEVERWKAAVRVADSRCEDEARKVERLTKELAEAHRLVKDVLAVHDACASIGEGVYEMHPDWVRDARAALAKAAREGTWT